MKKTLSIIVMMIMVFAAFTGCKSEKESRGDRTARILTAYISSYEDKEGTTFEFLDRESAEDFMYYWLDWGQTVGGVIEHTDNGHYYVTVCEYDFDDVCQEVVMEMNEHSSPKKDRK